MREPSPRITESQALGLTTRTDSDRDNTRTLTFARLTRPEIVLRVAGLDIQTIPQLPASTLKTYLR